MMHSGLLSINVRTLGVNRDNTLAYIARLQPAFTLCQDDPELTAKAQSLGTRVIHRESGDENLGVDITEFVTRRARNAPTASYIHTFNELGLTSALAAKEIECMKVAETLGRKCCIINAATNKSTAEWDAMRPALARAARNGHAIGVHVYLDGRHDGGAFDWVPFMREYGGVWIITEFAYIKTIFDPNTGWRGTLSAEQYASWTEVKASQMHKYNTPLMFFSFEHWKPDEYGRRFGFGFADEKPVTDVMVRINQTLKWNVPMPVPPPAPPVSPIKPGRYRLSVVPTGNTVGWLNVRSLPSMGGAITGRLHLQDVVTITSERDGWVNIVSGWVSRQSGAVEFTEVASSQTPTILLDVPYVSQSDVNSNRIGNDCPEASALSVIGWSLKRAGHKPMPALTVNMLVNGRRDEPKPTPHIVSILNGFGVPATASVGLNLARIRAEIDAGRPCILLTNYKHIGGASFGHFVTAVGYNADGFLIHEPYQRGATLFLSNAKMELALTDLNGISSIPYQGVLVNP